MTADETASGQPGALERAVTGDCFEGVLGAGRVEPAARRERGRNAPLVSADQQSKGLARELEQRQHESPGTENGIPP
jgi:hypothetical protein